MKFFDLATLVVGAAILTDVGAKKWAWPDQKQHKIDGKVTFADEPEGASSDNRNQNSDDLQNEAVQADEYPLNSQGNRQFSGPRPEKYQVDPVQINTYEHLTRYTNRHPSSQEWTGGYDGTLDTVGSCQCLRQRDCNAPATLTQGSCEAGKFLCCFDRRGKPARQPALESNQQYVLVGPGGPTGIIGPGRPSGFHSGGGSNNILVRPEGPTGIIGPNTGALNLNSPIGSNERPILVGPEGPTGFIGPNSGPNSGVRRPNYLGHLNQGVSLSGPIQRPVLVGPGGPTGIIGPSNGYKRPDNGILVGPGGSTGLIGPTRRPILVGPGGPTGIIGPASFNKPGSSAHGVLVGPGGPTGIVGPAQYYNRQYNRGLLVGPGGPTGIIGPSRYGQSF